MTARFHIDRWGRCEEVLSPDARLAALEVENAALEASRALRIRQTLGVIDLTCARPTLTHHLAQRETREVRV